MILSEFGALQGGERSILAAARCLRDRFALEAACPAPSPLAGAWGELGVPVTPWKLRGDRGGSREPLTVSRSRLVELIRARRPNLVHANSVSATRVLGPLCRDGDIRGIGHLRDMIRLPAAPLRDVATATMLVGVSHATRAWYVDQGVARERVSVVYNGVDLETFHPEASTGFLLEELGLPRSMRLVGGIGQISLRKGWETFLAAAELIASRREDVAFLIAGCRYGEKDETRSLESRLRAAGSQPVLKGRWFLTGFRSDVPPLLKELDLLMHAANQEPLGRVLLEAAASACPVVATNVGGTAEIFPPLSETARLVPPKDPAAMADAVLDMLEHRDQALAMGRRAHRRCRARFDAARSARALARIYTSIAASPM